MSAQASFKDLAFGIVVGCCFATVVYRAIELAARSYVEATDVPAERWVSQGQACVPRDADS